MEVIAHGPANLAANVRRTIFPRTANYPPGRRRGTSGSAGFLLHSLASQFSLELQARKAFGLAANVFLKGRAESYLGALVSYQAVPEIDTLGKRMLSRGLLTEDRGRLRHSPVFPGTTVFSVRSVEGYMASPLHAARTSRSLRFSSTPCHLNEILQLLHGPCLAEACIVGANIMSVRAAHHLFRKLSGLF